jgi:F0F1-type ATP synthase assembly protein I
MHPVLAKKLAVGQPILVVVAAIQIALKHIKWVFSGSSGNGIPRLPQDLKTVCELGYQHKTSVG